MPTLLSLIEAANQKAQADSEAQFAAQQAAQQAYYDQQMAAIKAQQEEQQRQIAEQQAAEAQQAQQERSQAAEQPGKLVGNQIRSYGVTDDAFKGMTTFGRKQLVDKAVDDLLVQRGKGDLPEEQKEAIRKKLYGSYNADMDKLDRSVGDAVGDGLYSLGTGFMGGVQSLTNLAGADNAVSKYLGREIKEQRSEMSDYARSSSESDMADIAKAKQSGSNWEKVKAYAGAAANVDTALQGIGSSIPTMVAMAATGGAAGAGAAVGAVQGVGSVKGSQYETTFKAAKDKGMSDSDADRVAAAAQSYAEGIEQQAIGGAIGAVVGATGIQGAVAKALGRRAADAATDAVAKSIAEPAKHSVLKQLGKNALLVQGKEGVTEGVQSAHETYAGNSAAIDSDVLQSSKQWQNVLGSAVQGTVGGALSAGPFAVLNTRNPNPTPPAGDTQDNVSTGATPGGQPKPPPAPNAGAQQTAQTSTFESPLGDNPASTMWTTNLDKETTRAVGKMSQEIFNTPTDLNLQPEQNTVSFYDKLQNLKSQYDAAIKAQGNLPANDQVRLDKINNVLSTLNNFYTTRVDDENGNPIRYSSTPLTKRAAPSTVAAIVKNITEAGSKKRFISPGTNAGSLSSFVKQVGEMTSSDTPFSYLKRAIKTTDTLLKEYDDVFQSQANHQNVIAVKNELNQLRNYYIDMEHILATGNGQTLNALAQKSTFNQYNQAAAEKRKVNEVQEAERAAFDGSASPERVKASMEPLRQQAALDAKDLREAARDALKGTREATKREKDTITLSENLSKGDETEARMFVAEIFRADHTVNPDKLLQNVNFLRATDTLPNGTLFGNNRGYTDLATGQIYLNKDALIDIARTNEYRNTPGAFSDKQIFLDKRATKATIIHELMHSNVDVLGNAKYQQLIKHIKRWDAVRKGVTQVEVDLFNRAKARMAAEGINADVGVDIYDAELLAYVTEEAVNAGIEPDNLAREGTIKKLLASLADLFRGVLKKLIPRSNMQVGAEDLVTIAYALAGKDYQNKANMDSTLTKVYDELQQDYKPINAFKGKAGFYSGSERRSINMSKSFMDYLNDTPFDPEKKENQLPDSRLFMVGRLFSDTSKLSISALEMEDGTVSVETLDDSSGVNLFEQHTFPGTEEFFDWAKDKGYVVTSSMSSTATEVPRPGATYRNVQTSDGAVNTNEDLVQRAMMLDENTAKLINKLRVIPGSEMWLDTIAGKIVQMKVKVLNADALIFSIMEAVKGVNTAPEIRGKVDSALQQFDLMTAKNRADMSRVGDETMSTYDRRQSILDSIKDLSALGMNEFDVENSVRAMFAQQESLLNAKEAYAGMNKVPITNQTAFHWSPGHGNIKPNFNMPMTDGSFRGVRMKLVDDKDGSLFLSRLTPQQFEVVKQLTDKMVQLNDAMLDAEYASKFITKELYESMKGRLYLPMRERGTSLNKTGLKKEARVTRSQDNTIESLFASITARSNNVARNQSLREFGQVLMAHPIPELVTVNKETAKVTSIADLEEYSNDTGHEGSWVYIEDGKRIVITPALAEHRELLKKTDRSAVLAKLAATQRFASMVRVMFVPMTQVAMLLRDAIQVQINVQAAFPKLSNEEALSAGYNTVLNGFKSFSTLAKSRGGQVKLQDKKLDSAIKSVYDANGGGIAVGSRYGIETANRDVLSAIDDGSNAKTWRHTKDVSAKGRDKALGFLHALEDVYRFGSFKTYLEIKHGGPFASEEQFRTFIELNPEVLGDAIMGSKKLLGNFDKRGTTQTGPALMMFFNSTMQGNTSFYGALHTSHGRRMLTLFALTTLALAMVDIGGTEEDESGKSLASRRSLQSSVIGFGDLWYPVPAELRGVASAAKNIAYLANGDISAGEFAFGSAMSLAQTFLPFQVEGSAESDNPLAVPALSFVPALGQGVAQTMFDINAFGGKLTNDAVYDKEGRQIKNPADFMKINQSDSEWAVSLAEGLYKYTSLDTSPAGLEANASALLGGVYNTMLKPALNVASGKMDTVDALNRAINPMRNPAYKRAVDDDFEKTTKGIFVDANLGDVKRNAKGRNVLLDSPDTRLRTEALKVTKEAAGVKINGFSMADAIRKKEQAAESGNHIQAEKMDALIDLIGQRKRKLKGDFLKKIEEGEFE